MRFTREELASHAGKRIPDLAGDETRLLFVGINPGLWTAAVQTHFAHPTNRFYPALDLAGITQAPIDPSAGMTETDRRLFVQAGMAITNICPAATARASELSLGQLRHGADTLCETIRRLRPRVVAIAGVTAYRQAFGRPKAVLGLQAEDLEGAQLWLVPNPSGLNAHESVESLARAYAEPARAAGVIS